jgi:hypothetical protein
MCLAALRACGGDSVDAVEHRKEIEMSKTTQRAKSVNRKGKTGRTPAAVKRRRVSTRAMSPGTVRAGSKLDKILTLLRRPAGATVEQMVTATGWQAHSVRGAISGALKKKLGLAIESTKQDGRRVYRIAAAA